MMEWLNNHLDYPYPDIDTKLNFVAKTGLSIGQVNNWFINSNSQFNFSSAQSCSRDA